VARRGAVGADRAWSETRITGVIMLTA